MNLKRTRKEKENGGLDVELALNVTNNANLHFDVVESGKKEKGRDERARACECAYFNLVQLNLELKGKL